jgi:hypothetical protein
VSTGGRNEGFWKGQTGKDFAEWLFSADRDVIEGDETSPSML